MSIIAFDQSTTTVGYAIFEENELIQFGNFTPKQKKNVEALGLRRREQVVVKEDNAQMRGMIAKVSHLVEVTEIAE